MFPLTVTAGDVGVMSSDHVPESLSILEIAGSIDLFTVYGFTIENCVTFQCTDKLRDSSISVFTVEDVCAAFEYSLMEVSLIEIVSGNCVIVLACDTVEFVHTVVHAAVFD